MSLDSAPGSDFAEPGAQSCTAATQTYSLQMNISINPAELTCSVSLCLLIASSSFFDLVLLTAAASTVASVHTGPFSCCSSLLEASLLLTPEHLTVGSSERCDVRRDPHLT